MIEVTNLVKKYDLTKKQQKELQTNAASINAVNNISLVCKPGSVFSLLGANGAGKTTTLRMIATILQPSAGSILVDGINVTENPQEVRKRIGFLTGSTHLYERLTPSEVVDYFGALQGMEKALVAQRKDELFTQLGIHAFSTKRIGQMSTGMKQKVSIARSMIHNPSVVIFDEPTSGLDVITAASIISLIKQCKAEGKTIIFSSHIMSEVDLLCDDLAIINKGELVYADTMQNFRAAHANQSLTEAFINIVNQNSVTA
jgi:sodium transport system ATP-binding protein